MFYTDTAALGRDTVVLSGPEGRHAGTVRRLRPGEAVTVGDGSGLVASCVVSTVDRGSVSLSVLSREQVPVPSPSLTVVQAIPKGDRGELAVEEMTEVGVDRIVPWAAARCVPSWDASSRALDRWRAKVRESAKQSLRAWIPSVTPPASTAEAAGLIATSSLAVLLDPGASVPLASLPVPAMGDVLVIVGPEGGITPDEAATLTEAGAAPCRLGPSVLRTSTAGAVASAILLSRTPRWNP